jgi:uncharacterized small protein (DUF1192 family)
MTKPIISIALVFATGAIALSPGFAQDVGVPRGMMGMMGGGCPTIGMMGGWGHGWGRGMTAREPRMGAVIEGRLAYLKGELAITEAQIEPWKAYSAAVETRVELMQTLHQSMVETMQSGTASERMDARIASMEAMLASLKAMKPATEALYAVLDDNQKKVADELIGADCGAM